MESVKVEIEVPKEGKEVVDAVSAVIAHFMGGKSLAEAAALLPVVMQAVDGYDKVSEGLKGDGSDDLAGYAVYKVLGALKK